MMFAIVPLNFSEVDVSAQSSGVSFFRSYTLINLCNRVYIVRGEVIEHTSGFCIGSYRLLL